MRSKLSVIAIVAILFACPATSSAGAPTADDAKLYASTVATTRGLPEPPYLTFVANVTLHGNVSTTLLDRHGIAVFRIWIGKGD